MTDAEQMLLQQMHESALGETRAQLHHAHFATKFRDRVKHEYAPMHGLLESSKPAKA